MAHRNYLSIARQKYSYQLTNLHTRIFFPTGRFFSTSFWIWEHHNSKKKIGFVYDFSVSFSSVL